MWRDQALAHVPHRRQPEDDAQAVAVDHRREVGLRPVDVGHLDGDAHGPALGQVDGRLLQAGLDAGQQGGQVLGRVVRLEVGGLVGHVAVAEAVRLVEGVVGEGLDDVEPLRAQLGAVAVGLAPGGELLPLLGDEVAVLLPAVVDEEVLDHRVGALGRPSGSRSTRPRRRTRPTARCPTPGRRCAGPRAARSTAGPTACRRAAPGSPPCRCRGGGTSCRSRGAGAAELVGEGLMPGCRCPSRWPARPTPPASARPWRTSGRSGGARPGGRTPWPGPCRRSTASSGCRGRRSAGSAGSRGSRTAAASA